MVVSRPSSHRKSRYGFIREHSVHIHRALDPMCTLFDFQESTLPKAVCASTKKYLFLTTNFNELDQQGLVICEDWEGHTAEAFMRRCTEIDAHDGLHGYEDIARAKSFLPFGNGSPILTSPTLLFLLADSPSIDKEAVLKRVINFRLDSHLSTVKKSDLTVEACFDPGSLPIAQKWVEVYGVQPRPHLPRGRTVQKVDLTPSES